MSSLIKTFSLARPRQQLTFRHSNNHPLLIYSVVCFDRVGAGWKGQLFNCLFDAPLVNACGPASQILNAPRAQPKVAREKVSAKILFSARAKVIKRKVFAGSRGSKCK
jgi:hypothetical protein